MKRSLDEKAAEVTITLLGTTLVTVIVLWVVKISYYISGMRIDWNDLFVAGLVAS